MFINCKKKIKENGRVKIKEKGQTLTIFNVFLHILSEA